MRPGSARSCFHRACSGLTEACLKAAKEDSARTILHETTAYSVLLERVKE